MTTSRTVLPHDTALATGDVRTAPAPLAASAASKLAVVVALLLAAAGVVLVRDTVIALGWASGTALTPPVANALGRVTPQPWWLVAGAAAAVVGIALMIAAVAPRRRTAVPLAAGDGLYLHRADVATLADTSASAVPGVLNARVTVKRSRVLVDCRVTGDDHAVVRTAVTDAVTTALSALAEPPRVAVRTRGGDSR